MVKLGETLQKNILLNPWGLISLFNNVFFYLTVVLTICLLTVAVTTFPTEDAVDNNLSQYRQSVQFLTSSLYEVRFTNKECFI